MSQTVELNQGEIYVKFATPTPGEISFEELGMDENFQMEGGFLRMVFDFEGIGEHPYYKVPTIEVTYDQDVKQTLWQCEFNGVTILDKADHFGHSTVVLLDRDKIMDLEHHHENQLILHAEFPREVKILTKASFVNFFK